MSRLTAGLAWRGALGGQQRRAPLRHLVAREPRVQHARCALGRCARLPHALRVAQLLPVRPTCTWRSNLAASRCFERTLSALRRLPPACTATTCSGVRAHPPSPSESRRQSSRVHLKPANSRQQFATSLTSRHTDLFENGHRHQSGSALSRLSTGVLRAALRETLSCAPPPAASKSWPNELRLPPPCAARCPTPGHRCPCHWTWNPFGMRALRAGEQRWCFFTRFSVRLLPSLALSLSLRGLRPPKQEAKQTCGSPGHGSEQRKSTASDDDVRSRTPHLYSGRADARQSQQARKSAATWARVARALRILRDRQGSQGTSIAANAVVQ